MVKLTVLFVLLCFSGLAFSKKDSAQAPSIIPKEAWVKLECFGTTTPIQRYPIVTQLIETYYLKANVLRPFPSIFELRDSNSTFFTNMLKSCNEKRTAMVDLTGYTGNWLDWGTDHQYHKLVIGEEIFFDNACRVKGKPCSTDSQCCRSLYCNKSTNSCVEDLVIGPSGK